MKKDLHSLLQAVGLRVPAGLANPEIAHITCDSRNVKKGSLFFGLSGQKVDGGMFWEEAIASGAAAAVIGKGGKGGEVVVAPSLQHSVVVVSRPVERWMGEISSCFWGHPSSKMVLIGVTGTNGKTTTTHLIDYLGSALGKATALFGTLSNSWPHYTSKATHTTNFSDLLQAQLSEALLAGTELCAMEVSSHSLEQNRVAGCDFSGAIFTNLTQDHLDYHHSMDLYFEAKAKLFEPPFLNQGKNKVVVNIDDFWGKKLSERLGEDCWGSSLSNDHRTNLITELTMRDLVVSEFGVEGRLISPLGEGKFNSPLLGRFNLMNVLQAVGSLLQQGFPLPELLEAISSFPGVPGRMECVKTNGNEGNNLPTVLVDYAHTPDGLKNALEASRAFVRGKLVCVFGCGGDRDRGKRKQMGFIAAQLADRVVVTSDNPRTEDPEQILNEVIEGIPNKKSITIQIDRALAIRNAILQSCSGDVILVAGKGHEDYQIIGTNRLYFDDREVARNALASMKNN